MTSSLDKTATFAALPPVWPQDPLPAIRQRLHRPDHKVVILDDDPTGTQTVRDVAVVTCWSEEILAAELRQSAAGFFILTNSRSLDARDTAELHRDLARNLRAAATAAGVTFTLISRADSTLRGHFPLETDTLAAEAGPFHATLLVPYFEAGGRYTLGGIHYVATNDTLVPAAATPFARDATFGYQQSSLRAWVEEKSGGRIVASDVAGLPLSLIRTGGPEAVARALDALPAGATCAADCASPRDAEVIALGTMLAAEAGRPILCRTAASYVAARLGQPEHPPLSDPPAPARGAGGLIIVGSHVPKTANQLGHLQAQVRHAGVELAVPRILHAGHRKGTIAEATRQVDKLLHHGHLTLLHTSRDLVTGASAEESLAISRSVSSALVEVVRNLQVRPGFLIAKGGITSSDVATIGLGVRRAIVRGQLLPGVPVWRLGAESKFPGLDYVVFPGNVGSDSALTDAVHRLQPTPVLS
jgi:uncharacterized protein YgbK (DUF1537 family)